MKTWTKRLSIAITALTLLASQATLVLARGGGGKGGSLGGSAGRSFSGGSFSGGGYSGGFRGFTPFFFFGGPSYGHGSIFGGFFTFIFLLVILFLIFKALRSRNRWNRGGRGWSNGPVTKPYEGPVRHSDQFDLPDQTPVDLSGRPITNDDNLRRFGKAISFTRENMQYYAEMFPRWDRDLLVGRVKQVFYWLQDAWSRQDLSGAQEYLTPALAAKYQADLNAMKGLGERNVIREPMLNNGDIEFIHSHMDELDQHFMVMIHASLIDYTIDASGRIVSGDENHRLYFTEFWEFVWQNDKWLLSNIYQEDSLEVAKIARGDEQ